MALQTSISQYFNSRKRPADEIKRVSNSNKVLILDKNSTDVSLTNDIETEGSSDLVSSKNKVIFTESPKIVVSKRIGCSAPKIQRKTPKTSSLSKRKQNKITNQGDIRRSLLPCFEATIEDGKELSENVINSNVGKELVVVPFEIKAVLSPKKKLSKPSNYEKDTASVIAEAASVIAKAASSSDYEQNISEIHKTPKKQLGLKDIRAKLISSKRLDELKKALKKVNESQDKLRNIQAKIPPKSPSLKQFKNIELEVITSPSKKVLSEETLRRPPSSPSLLQRSRLMSPGRPTLSSPRSSYLSPRKLFSDPPASSPGKSATRACERYASLSVPSNASVRPFLSLPFKYRSLAETFRTIDTVVSMLYNRKEAISFSKLKSSVQQMSKKNLTEQHIGQILTVYPNAFTFKQEKLRTHLGEKYELMITPVLCEKGTSSVDYEDEAISMMTPSVILERKRQLYLALLERTKDFHEEFLESLDPPLFLDRSKLTRWHPEFDVDGVPDILPSPLPQPPCLEKLSTAKDVLSKAREMFACNPRMERALKKACSPQLTERQTAPSPSPTPATKAAQALASALNGIPKSLLEKVRARQAAKAAEMLTQNPAAVKKRVEMSRLPELARILRNIFVAEKKNVLPQALVLRKLKDSCRESLSTSELDYHINLIMKASPSWLSIVDFGKDHFLKISKETQLSSVLKDIENVGNEG